MPSYALIQLTSIAITGGLYATLPGLYWIVLVVSLGFTHYTLALYYAGNQLISLLKTPQTYVPLSLLFIVAVMLYDVGFPLVLYFGLHHAFNEVYLRNRSLPEHLPVTAMRLVAVLFHLSAYLFLLYGMALSRTPYLPLALTVISLTAIAYFYFIFTIRKSLPRDVLIDNCAFELLLVALLPVALYYRFEFQQIVLYHFVFWFIFPFIKILRENQLTGALRFSAWSVLVTLLFLAISPLGVGSYRLKQDTYEEMFILLSYLHITLAFATSMAHPDWIVRWFRRVV